MAEFSLAKIEKQLKLEEFIDKAKDCEVVCEATTRQALSMSLQARKLKTNLEKSRMEIIRPHLDFQKAVSKLIKDYEAKLEEIELGLKAKIDKYLESTPQKGLIDISVEDGTMKTVSKWIHEIEDKAKIPDEYLMVDEDKIKKAVKAGIRNIPGIKIYQTTETTMRAKS